MKTNKVLKVFLFAATVILTLTSSSCKKSPEKVSNVLKTPDKKILEGSWLRTDAENYKIDISGVNEDKSLNAQYFNPDPINVGLANWEDINGSLKITIELRDINYPGSTYTLNYLPERDILAGDYYQAVEGLNFYVEFNRIK